MGDKYRVFFDFDNTITKFDVIDDILERFSVNDKWIDLEKRWKAGRIGSKECLKGQLGGVRMTKKELDRYLSHVGIDPYFKKLLKLLRSNKIKTTILSDDFDYILNRVLKLNGISGLDVYSNRLKLDGDRLMPRFPIVNKSCLMCGHCKKKSMFSNSRKCHTVVYIGDGASDVCASKHADLVFAKGTLAKYFASKKLDHIPIKGLKDTYEYFKRRLP
ncbi:MAG: MtnX-like HAD-IB family phosphatase [Candidatus Omnitrophota bacterium]|jgi:2,3-diketo-5-methylthio-1-phosphopentane phosphatase